MYKVELYRKHIIVSDDVNDAVINTLTNELFFCEKSHAKTEIKESEFPCYNKEDLRIDASNCEVDGVTICAAETCNMRCTYCFANAGSYNTEHGRAISEESLAKIREVLWKINANGVKSIHFFGGEPLLAKREIFRFCGALLDEYKQKGLEAPHFSLTTNASLITDNIARLLKKYHVSVCVSIDGPEEIHDRRRIFRDGTGTFQKTMTGIRKLQKENIPPVAEATVSVKDFSDMSKDAMYRFFDFFREAEICAVAFFMDVNEKDSDLDIIAAIEHFYQSLTDYYFDLLTQENQKPNDTIIFTNVLSAILKILSNTEPTVCMAGLSQVFLTANGDIYPCQTYYASRKTLMGSIDDIIAYECARQSVEKDIANRVSAECLQCSYYRYCENKCPGSNLLATGKESQVSRPLCYAAQSLVNHVIYRLAKLGNAPEAYQIFIERLHKAAAAAQVLGG